MKTKQLIQTFTDKELMSIEKALLTQKNAQLLPIFSWLKKHEEYEKEILFEFVYKETYSTKKDYLLRNEIRNLNTFLKEYIVRKEIFNEKNDWLSKKILLEYYLNSKQVKLFEEEWDEIYKKLNREENLQQYFELIQLKVTYHSNHKPVKENEYLPLVELLEEAKTYMDNLSMQMQFEFYRHYAFAHRVLYSITHIEREKQVQKVTYSGDIDNLFKSTQLKHYLVQQYDIHIPFEEKIELFKKILLLLEGKEIEQIPIYNNLGVEYFIRGDFENAYKYYSIITKIIKENDVQLNNRLLHPLLNYISSAVSIGKYDEAIQFYIENEKTLSTLTNIFHNIQRLIALAYLFSNKTKEAFDFMPQNINERGKHEYYYYRAVYTLGYLLDKDYDLAARESENCYRALKANPFTEGDFEKLFLALKHLVDYKTGKIQKKNQILEYLEQENYVGFHIKKLITNIL